MKLIMRDDGWDGSLKTGSCSFRVEGENGWAETGDANKIACSENLQKEIEQDTHRHHKCKKNTTQQIQIS